MAIYLTFVPGETKTALLAVPASQVIVFDGRGSVNAKFVIDVSGYLSLGASVRVEFKNEALPENVTWNISGYLSFGAGAQLSGNVNVGGYTTFGAGASMVGTLNSTGTITNSSVNPFPIREPLRVGPKAGAEELLIISKMYVDSAQAMLRADAQAARPVSETIKDIKGACEAVSTMSNAVQSNYSSIWLAKPPFEFVTPEGRSAFEQVASRLSKEAIRIGNKLRSDAAAAAGAASAE